MTNTSVRKIFSTMSWQIVFLLLTIGILSLINVSVAHSCNKSRLCRLLCCSIEQGCRDPVVPDVGLECDKSCNECKTNSSVGDVCEGMNHNGQLRRCNPDFTCADTCRQEYDSVGREDDEDDIDFGSGDNFAYVTQVLKVTRTDSSENPPLDFDSSWRLNNIQIILIITAVCLCFLIICMLLIFAIRFAVKERKMASSPNRGQYPTSVFYTSGKMVMMNQGHRLNQPSLDFSSAWC